MEDMDKEDYRKPSGDEGEVVFSQQEEGAVTAGPHGPRMDRQNENGWLEDTEPYHGARPRMIDVNQLVGNVLGATMGMAGQDLDFRDTPAPTTNPTGGRNPDATTTGTTQRWKSTTERRDTEPYHGARPRMIDVNQLIDNVLGATMGTAGQDLDFRDTPAPTTNPTGGRNPDATTTGTTQRWKSTTERTPVKDEWNSVGP